MPIGLAVSYMYVVAAILSLAFLAACMTMSMCTIFYAEKFSVKCNQSGKLYTVKVNSLSRKDEQPLTTTDLEKGSQLLMDYRKKSYPVTFVKHLTEVEPQGLRYFPCICIRNDAMYCISRCI